MKQAPLLLGLALLTGATLALEVLDTRLLSVLTWYSLAFLVIGMGLCGLTAGAVRVYLEGDAAIEGGVPAALSRAALRFALSVPASYVLLLLLPLRSEPVATTVVLYLVFAAAIALPFYPAGAAIAIALTRTALPVGRVYAVDLLGAALGAPLVPLLLSRLDAGSGIVLVGALGAASAIAFARAGGAAVEARRGAWALAGLVALAAANAATDRGLKPIWVKERADVYALQERELWNSHSRVQIYSANPGPATFWGMGTRCHPPTLPQRLLVIDGHAATFLYDAAGDLSTLRFLECDVTDVANLLRPGGSAAIIGVGGSRDVQAALLAGRERVVGIELNDRMLEVLNGPLGEPTLIPRHPGVTLVHDDGRSYLSRSRERFRMVQASLIDTWAATGAGAHALGENGLYTLEAWGTFLDRVEPGGLFTVSRWTTVETARMVALAVGALLARGVETPRQNVALLSAGNVSTILVGVDPFTPEDVRALAAIAEERGFDLVVPPGGHVQADRLEAMLSARTPGELERVSLLPDLDFRPPVDDRPFFFNALRPRAMLRRPPAVTEGTIEGNLLATRSLGLAVLASLVLAVLAIVVPLRARAVPGAPRRPGLGAALAYFALVGVGFMLVEVALLQRLSLVLGHPVYGLVVVLACLVAAAGVGSFASDRLPLHRAPLCYLYPLVIAAVVVAFAVGWPALAPRLLSATTEVRVAWAAGISTLLGLPLGVAFPAGMRIATVRHADEAPWLFGLNGVGSVGASGLAVLVALTHGLTALLGLSAACYVALVPALLWMRRASDPAT